jgi:hypothetical protein
MKTSKDLLDEPNEQALATSRRKIERCVWRGRIARHRENCNIERFAAALISIGGCDSYM